MRAPAQQQPRSAGRPAPSAAERLPDLIKVCRAAGDNLRANILRVLAEDAFAVLELGKIFAMAQPAISHHLKTLSDAGLVTRRREGTSIFYQRPAAIPGPLVQALFSELDGQPLDAILAANISEIYQQRLQHSEAFFNLNADALKQQTEMICAPSVYADAVTEAAVQQAAVQRRHALEVGPGDGTVLARLSKHFTRVTGVDNAGSMLNNTRRQVGDLQNVELLEADFLKLPRKPRYQLVVASMVLHHSASPAAFFRQAAALLQPAGLLVITELCTHNQQWVQAACGDIWLGFDPRQLTRWAEQTGFSQRHRQFLAQRNGFRVQVHTYQLNSVEPQHARL